MFRDSLLSSERGVVYLTRPGFRVRADSEHCTLRFAKKIRGQPSEIGSPSRSLASQMQKKTIEDSTQLPFVQKR